jgi:hypothetical protein
MRKEESVIYEFPGKFIMTTPGQKDIEIPHTVSHLFWAELVNNGFEFINWQDPQDDFLGFFGT